MNRRFVTFLILASVVYLCACQDTQRKPWVEQLDGGAVDAPGPPPDVPDTSDARPDIEVPPAPDCQQASTTLPAQVKRLSGAEAALTVDASFRDPKVSPNGCYVGFKTPNGEVRIIDLTGEPGEWTVRNPAVGSDIGFEALAFSGPGQNSVWLGSSSGSIHHLGLNDFSHLRSIEPTRDLSEDIQFDSLDVGDDNRFVAWVGDNLEPELGGVYDLQEGQNVQTWETSPGGGAPIDFVPGRSFLIVRTAEDDGTVEIYDPAAGETVRSFNPLYGGDRSSIWAASQSWFAIAYIPQRRGVISRLDYDSRETTVLDPDPRGGHYTDLYASPSGRWLIEWDFEHSTFDDSGEASILRFDMSGDRPPRKFGHSFLGFGGATDLAFSRISDLAGLEMYDPENGEALGTIGAFDGRDVARVVGISANRLAIRWHDDNATKLSILTGSPPNQ